MFCGGRLLVSYLRPANIDAARHSRAILKLLVDRLRQAWPKVRIVFRGDSGFCRWRLLRWCDRHGVGYVVGLARNKTLERMAAPAMAEAERLFKGTGQAQRSFHELRYAAGTWDRERRVIHKAEHNAGGDNPRFVVTNLDDPPADLYDRRYCPRGEMENRIKEQQLGLFADRTSCHAFAANQFRLLLGSFAYGLVETLRRTALAGTERAAAQATTIRTKLLKIGAVVAVTARRVVLRLSAAYPLQSLFADVARRLVAMPTPRLE